MKYSPDMTAQQEEQLIDNEFALLMQTYLSSHHRKRVEKIEQAFRFARRAHRGIRRRSGEPYILHPIAVAQIVSAEIGLGSTSICAALLHDVVEDTDYTVDDIRQQFGDKIAELVDGLTKISGGIFGDHASAQAENFRKLLLTMSHDIRVVLIKMADRLHNMRTLGSMLPSKQYKIAGETLYIYAPLAHRLGFFSIKTELEDLSFKYQHPGEYSRIEQLIAQSEQRRQQVYGDFSAPILQRLDDMGIKYTAASRVKSVYSIWHKMERKHIPFEEVYDLYAMRIIFDCDNPTDEKTLCWRIYSAITEIYNLHPERTRDWISTPKTNGYQALHLTVMGPDGNWVEVQIRSHRMDEIAEKGLAAHWKYKLDDNDKSSVSAQEELQLSSWLKSIKDILDDPNPNAIDFLDTLKLNLYTSEITVFTPKGELMTLPAGATVLDMAFALHSQVGSHCIAGKINHKLVPLSHQLNSGDQVEVLTSQNAVPRTEWLQIVTTAKARTRLRSALRRAKAPMVNLGRQRLEQFLSDAEVPLTNEVLTKIQAYYHIPLRDDFYYRLGTDDISLKGYILKDSPKANPSLLKKIFRLPGASKPAKSSASPSSEYLNEPKIVTPEHIDRKNVYNLRITDTEQNFAFAPCCHPMPGDDVMGYITDSGTVEVHSLECQRAQTLKAAYGPRILAAQWSTDAHTFPAEIAIDGVDRRGILNELIQLISARLGINIRAMHIDTHHEVFSCTLSVRVANTSTLQRMCQDIKKIKGITNANRIK